MGVPTAAADNVGCGNRNVPTTLHLLRMLGLALVPAMVESSHSSQSGSDDSHYDVPNVE